jgi:lipoprotein-anchoring transpeptidase ErfK/SrfK
MRRVSIPMLFLFLAALFPATAVAGVQVDIDVGSQTMQVFVNGHHRHTWRVSTGRRGYNTPIGTYRPKRLEAKWYSTKYDYSPMPYAVFFHGGYAIHGTYETRRLGRRASHGCVRLATGHAAQLFRLVRRYGLNNTVIQILY